MAPKALTDKRLKPKWFQRQARARMNLLYCHHAAKQKLISGSGEESWSRRSSRKRNRDPQFDRQFSKERYIVSNWDLAPVR